MIIRELRREELNEIWSIDRSEKIENIYRLEDGRLVLKPEHHDMKGWPPGEAESYGPLMFDCFDRGGTFLGAFEEGKLKGVSVIESRFIGRNGDRLQLKFLHVAHGYRKTGLGRTLFERAVDKARNLGANTLYVSATPSENTIDFYLHIGCRVTDEVDRELFKLEPDDIHLEFTI